VACDRFDSQAKTKCLLAICRQRFLAADSHRTAVKTQELAPPPQKLMSFKTLIRDFQEQKLCSTLLAVDIANKGIHVIIIGGAQK